MSEQVLTLSTDLYELTMAAAYFENGLHQPAVFELFVRSLPPHRSYLIAAGLEQALDYLANLRFSSSEIEFLRQQPVFKHVSAEFLDYLAELRFTGDVWAMPEGTAAFAMEPLLRVTAPIIQAQIVETFLLSTVNFQTLIASKAARVVTAARGHNVTEFGTRRAHGPQAGLLAARAAYIGGCAGTSNVEAGRRFGIPMFGTLAHSFVMAFDQEEEAFEAFLKVFPETATILADTYDTIAAVKTLARKFGSTVPAVRLDSGDLLGLSRQVRQILDDAGMSKTKIFASGDLNEYRIAELIANDAPIDAYGVGTELATSYDAPALGGIYKLVSDSVGGKIRSRMKLSTDKATYPHAKQVWRFIDHDHHYQSDLITRADEDAPHGASKPLLEAVMVKGRPTMRDTALSRLNQARLRAAEELKRLPSALLALDSEANYPVEFSEQLQKARAALCAEITAHREQEGEARS
jgi:nicotinate phosphoribosyltransferase